MCTSQWFTVVVAMIKPSSAAAQQVLREQQSHKLHFVLVAWKQGRHNKSSVLAGGSSVCREGVNRRLNTLVS